MIHVRPELFVLLFQSAKIMNFAATHWSLNDFPSPFETY